MRIDLTDQVVVVTGASRGIGRAVALAARDCGAKVAIVDCDASAARSLAIELGETGVAISADVSDEADCKRAVETVVAAFGAPDILVNSAGILGRLEGTKYQQLPDWRRVIDVNLQGTFLMAREAVRVMIPRRRGAIVNLASVAGLVGFRASNAYGVAKAGVAMLTKTLALDLAGKGIRVNAVAPGFIDTDMLRELELALGDGRVPIQHRTPLGRYGTVEEIAAVVLFLASDLSSFITGSIVPVDGGWTAFGGIGHAS